MSAASNDIARARRAAAKLGWRVCKSRDRTLHYNNRGGLMLVDDRNIEVHRSGSNRSVGKEGVEFGIGEHRLSSGGGMVTISGPPGMPPAVLYRPTYSFKIDGVDRKATEACATYLAFLRRMVAEFAAAHP